MPHPQLPASERIGLAQIAKRGQDDAVLASAYSVHGSASEVNRSGADAQIISCHCHLVVFHPIVEQLASRLLYQL